MALVVFLRGVNVGGHRRLRPSVIAKELARYNVVNVGSTGTFVVRKPGARTRFYSELRGKLPFETEITLCHDHELLRLESENPFQAEPELPDVVRFVSILSRAHHASISLPTTLPSSGEWFLRIIAADTRFVFGVYRRHMKTIGYLGQIDQLFGVTATTRNWNTIMSIVRSLKANRESGG
jgi:uncharacterized protein (DUF1697 family)